MATVTVLTSRSAVPPAKTHLLGPESLWMGSVASTGSYFQHSGESPATTPRPYRYRTDGTAAAGPFHCYGMKTPGRAKTVLSAVVSPSPSAPPSKIFTSSSAQIMRLLSFSDPGMTAF